MANARTSPAPIDADLQAEALGRFNPLVFTFSVQTGSTVCLPKVIEAMTRDPAFARGFYVLDKKRTTSVLPTTRGKQVDRRSKQVDNTKSTAAQLYEDYVRIAVDRELKRRDEERARAAEYAALLALYLEEGLTEAEAAEAARKEMEETAHEGSLSEEGDVRERLYVFLPTYPTTMEEVAELHNSGLSLHAVVSLSSRVPLSGSVAAEKPPPVSDSSKGKGKEKRETRKSLSKERNALLEEKTRLTLAAELQQYLEVAKCPPPYLRSICIHSYDVPTDAVPTAPMTNAATAIAAPNTLGDAAPAVVYRLKGTEAGVFSAIVDAVVMLEERYIGFCNWKERRVMVSVPPYVPLRYPQAVELSPVTVEEKGRKRPVSNRKKSAAPTPVVVPSNAEPIPVFDPEPKHMKDVVAHRAVYDAVLSLGKRAYFDKQTFGAACILQVAATLSMTNPELLDPFLTLSRREKEQMLKDKKECAAFVNYVFDVAMLGVDNAHQQLFSGANEMGPTDPLSRGARSVQNAVSSLISTSEPRIVNDVVSSRSDGNVDSTAPNIREAAVSLLSQSLGIEVGKARAMIAEVTSLGFIHSGRQGAIAHALGKNKSGSWRTVRVDVGGCELEVLYRGDGLSRTESSVYTFCGSATFADYVAWQKHCVAEDLYYNPPPPDSDEEEPSEEEEEEEEEEDVFNDDDDKGGEEKPVRLKTSRRKNVQEPPPVDAIRVADAALRRRRTYEDIQRRLCQKEDVVQEAMVLGAGAHCIAEETQWMFTDDGSTIEVRRVVGNTSHVHCSVTDFVDLAFGFLTMDEMSDEDVPLVISSTLRCFLTFDDVVRFFFEVVADNSRAVEQAAYIKALEAAKLEAKAQYEALEQTKTSRSTKEKVPLPPLAALEEALISQIPVPMEREPRKPMTNVRALFYDGAAVTFAPAENCLHFSAVQNAHRSLLIDVLMDVCVGDKVQRIRVSRIDAITVYADGCVVLHSQEIEGYRVSLDVFGNYATVNAEGAMLLVTAAGKRSIIQADGQKLSLEPLMVSTTVDTRTDAHVSLRQDGMQIVLGSGGRPEKVTYGTGCFSASSGGGGYTWHFMGFPEIRVHRDAGRLGFTLDRVETNMDLGRQTLHVIHHRSGGEAILDWATHRLHVRPMPNGNCFTVDCAFGGLVASSGVADYCVSPFGRCGGVREDVFRQTEVVSQKFLQRYEETGGNFEKTALQRNFHAFDFPIRAAHSTCRPASELTTATLSSYLRYSERSIDRVLSPGVQQSKDLLRGVVRMRGRDDDDGVLLFMNPWLSSTLLQRLKSDIDPTYSRLLPGASFLGGDLQEHILFLRPSYEAAGEQRSPVVPMAASVARFLLMSHWPITTQAPRDDNVTAVHILSAREGTALMTDDVAELLHHSRLSSSEAETWSKAMHTLPLVETTEGAGMNSLDTTRRTGPICDYAVSGSKTTRTVVPHTKTCAARDGKYNFWRSTGILVAAEVQEATLNEKGSDTAEEISASQGNYESPPVTTSTAADACEMHGGKNNLVPFMHSLVEREMPLRERCLFPTLSVTPSVLSFGRVIRGKRYSLPVALTNTSTVPCRYRVILSAEYKAILRVHYPRHFLAPGLTATAEVELSGTQPLGTMSVLLNVKHEGGIVTATVDFETVEEGEPLSPRSCNSRAVLLGPTLINSFVPGTTRRLPPHVLQREAAKKEEVAAASETM